MHLSPRQQSAIRESTCTLNVWYGSVSAGKTIAWLVMMLGEIATAGPVGELVIMGKTVDAIYRNVFTPLLTHPLFAHAAPEIRYRKGNTTAIIFGREVHVIGIADLGAEERIRGGTYQKVFYDELTLCPEPVFNMIMTRLRAPAAANGAPARMWATTNPDSAQHYLKEKWMDRPEETSTYSILFTMADNPGLDAEYVARTEAQFTGLFYQRFILGLWVAAEGAIYDMWDADTMVVPHDDLPEIVDYLAIGIDQGSTNPTGGILLGVGVDGVMYAVDEWAPDDALTTDGDQVLDYIQWQTTRPRPRYVYADPAAKSFREEMLKQGVGTHKAKNDVRAGIGVVASLLGGRKLRISDRCVHLIREFPQYVWDEKETKKGNDKPIKDKDHFLDGLRYGIFSSRHLWRNHIMLGV